MIWYYADGNQKKGPFSDNELRELLKSRVINPDTLVWRKGLDGWVPLSRFIKKNKSTAAKTDEPLRMEKTQCSHCRSFFPREQLVSIENNLICASCKPIALQKLKENANQMDSTLKKNSFFHQAAKASWAFPIIAVAVSVVTKNMFKEPNLETSRMLVSFFGIFLFLFGLCLGIIALFGIKKYGKEKILKPAIAGISVNFVVLAIFFMMIIVRIISES